jgi:hypothetical protein
MDLESPATAHDKQSSNFVSECISAQSFADYLADADTDTDNDILPHTRRWAWYCKKPECPGYYSAWLSKTNFLLHLYESTVHREDSATQTLEGRRQLATKWREETAFDMSEPKKVPPEG